MRESGSMTTSLGLLGFVFPIAAGLMWTANVYGQSLEGATHKQLVYGPFHMRLSGTATPYSLECTATDVSKTERRYACTYHFREFDLPATTSVLFRYDPAEDISLVQSLDRFYLHGDTAAITSVTDVVRDRLPLIEERDLHQSFEAARQAKKACAMYTMPYSETEMTLMRLECK